VTTGGWRSQRCRSDCVSGTRPTLRQSRPKLPVSRRSGHATSSDRREVAGSAGGNQATRLDRAAPAPPRRPDRDHRRGRSSRSRRDARAHTGLSDPRKAEARLIARARRPTPSTTPLPVGEQSGCAGTVAAIGVIRRRIRSGRRDRFRMPAAISFDDRFGRGGPPGPATAVPRTGRSYRGRPDDCMARMMRKSNCARSTSDATPLLL
jgi:hypothetical protein